MNVCILFIERHWLPLSIALLLVITVLSLSPLDRLPESWDNDKLHHTIAYAALMFPVALRRPRWWWAIASFYLAWSGGIELVQPYVNRYAEWADMAANASGLLAGMLLAHLCRLR